MPPVDNFQLFTSLRYDPSLQQVPSRGLRHAGWNYTHVSPFHALDLHRDRLLRAATHFHWTSAVRALTGPSALAHLAHSATVFLGPSQIAPARLRIVLHAHGTVEFQSFDTHPDVPLENLFPTRLPPPSGAPSSSTTAAAGFDAKRDVVFALLVAEKPIARSEFTHFKTSRRDVYDEARERAGIAPGERREVLMINAQDNSVMEASISTPYFWRGGRWITPPVSAEVSTSEGSGGNDGTSRRYALENKLAVQERISVDSLVDGEECWISNGVSGFIAAKLHLKESRFN